MDNILVSLCMRVSYQRRSLCKKNYVLLNRRNLGILEVTSFVVVVILSGIDSSSSHNVGSEKRRSGFLIITVNVMVGSQCQCQCLKVESYLPESDHSSSMQRS